MGIYSNLTTWKINMEPENKPLEEENHLPNHHFQVLCNRKYIPTRISEVSDMTTICNFDGQSHQTSPLLRGHEPKSNDSCIFTGPIP